MLMFKIVFGPIFLGLRVMGMLLKVCLGSVLLLFTHNDF